MAKVGWIDNAITTPAWAADYGERLTLVPGGATLKVADFAAGADGKKRAMSGALLGRTRAERTANEGLGPWTSGDEDVYLLYHDVPDMALDAECTLYRPGALVKENFLPAATQTNIATVRTLYRTTVGVQ